MKTKAVAVLALLAALAGCSSGSTSASSGNPSASFATTPPTQDYLALVWSRYGDCLTRLHVTRDDGSISDFSTGASSGPTVSGRSTASSGVAVTVSYGGSLRFGVTTGLNPQGQPYTVPDTATTRQLATVGC